MYIERVDLDCLPKLKDSVESNLDRYLEEDRYWLSEYIQELGYQTYPSNKSVNNLNIVYNPNDRLSMDLANAKALYIGLDIAPELGGNGGFWTILSHYYIPQLRQITSLSELEKEKKIEKIKDNFTFSKVLSKRDRRKGYFTRLWTIADLTYDPSRADKFELTRIALSKQDLAYNLIDRDLFLNRNITHAFLEYYDSREKDGDPITRDEYRSLFVFLHALDGMIIIDSLEKKDVVEKIREHTAWYKEKKNCAKAN